MSGPDLERTVRRIMQEVLVKSRDKSYFDIAGAIVERLSADGIGFQRFNTPEELERIRSREEGDQRAVALHKYLGPDGLATRIVGALTRENDGLCPTIAEVQAMSHQEITDIRNLGNGAVERIRNGWPYVKAKKTKGSK